MKILDTFKNFNYTYYNNCEKLQTEYDKMYNKIKASGYTLGSNDHWLLDAGILLENDDEVIAGAFFNLNKIKSSILILIIFVEEEHRKNGIYKRMHSLIDDIGNQENREAVYSYIHSKNDVMQQFVAKSIGYKTVMHLVSRPIKSKT
jgi:hypothetical protein